MRCDSVSLVSMATRNGCGSGSSATTASATSPSGSTAAPQQQPTRWGQSPDEDERRFFAMVGEEMNLHVLKEVCRATGLAFSGSKQELANRLAAKTCADRVHRSSVLAAWADSGDCAYHGRDFSKALVGSQPGPRISPIGPEGRWLLLLQSCCGHKGGGFSAWDAISILRTALADLLAIFRRNRRRRGGVQKRIQVGTS